jgi:hypothetical protein
MAEMPVTGSLRISTSVAGDVSSSDAHAPIQRAIRTRCTVFVKVEQRSIAYLKDGLVENVLLRTADN